MLRSAFRCPPRSHLPAVGPILGLVFFAHAECACAQSSPDAEVMKTVSTLFDGMRAGDSTVVRSVFHRSASFRSVVEREGQTAVRDGSVDGFVKAVGTPHDRIWDERIWSPVVLIDGPMATAWTPYAFFLGDSLSHCGVNAFTLVRVDGAWQIISITDTRRSPPCDLPPGAGSIE